jgi:hypothetical protein
VEIIISIHFCSKKNWFVWIVTHGKSVSASELRSPAFATTGISFHKSEKAMKFHFLKKIINIASSKISESRWRLNIFLIRTLTSPNNPREFYPLWPEDEWRETKCLKLISKTLLSPFKNPQICRITSKSSSRRWYRFESRQGV